VDLDGKVVVVTGASSGIGRRAALDLASEGAAVCAVARREARLRALIAELPGSRHSCFVADVSDLEQVQALARHVETVHGRCDVLVNNAGFSVGGAFQGEASLPDVERVLATNFFGTVYCTALLLPLLESSAPSVVVNVASMAGRLAYPASSAYVASKFAVVGWSESAAFDLKKRGVHLGLVEPGPIPTEGFPQDRLVGHPIMKHLLGSEEDVSQAIHDVIFKHKHERVVPRWYYLLQIPRLLAPRLARFFATRV
jgi:NAD(P)-dependent dehydrogenase (short-subunit alcohol dehydrogenase family)